MGGMKKGKLCLTCGVKVTETCPIGQESDSVPCEPAKDCYYEDANKSHQLEGCGADNVEWHEASTNNHGIETIAFMDLGKFIPNVGKIVGYNGILKGDDVIYMGKRYIVVMVSRLGHFGLSETGKLPYSFVAYPKEVEKIGGEHVIER